MRKLVGGTRMETARALQNYEKEADRADLAVICVAGHGFTNNQLPEVRGQLLRPFFFKRARQKP